jgi:hypothetical protein
MQPDPAVEIERLTSRWDALTARLVAAGLVGPDDVITCAIWSHGATVVVTDAHGVSTAYAMQPSGELFRFTCTGWAPVDEEPCS